MFEGRLKFLREQKGITMKKLASDLNMPYTTYINYEKNTREPNSEVLISIADYFNVTTDYLLGHNVSGVILDNASFTGDEQQIVSLYKELDIEDRAEIRGTIKGMLKNEKYTSVKNGIGTNTERKSQARITPDKSYKTLKGKYTKYNNVNAANAIEGFTDEERLEDEKYWSDFEDE